MLSRSVCKSLASNLLAIPFYLGMQAVTLDLAALFLCMQVCSLIYKHSKFLNVWRGCMQKIDMPKNLQDQFEDFHKFNTSRFFGQQADPIAICTSDKYADHARSAAICTHVPTIICGQLSYYRVDVY